MFILEEKRRELDWFEKEQSNLGKTERLWLVQFYSPYLLTIKNTKIYLFLIHFYR